MNINKRYRKNLSKNIYKKQFIKLFISILIILLVLLINNINTAYTKKGITIIKKTLNYELDMNDKRIKDIKKAVTALSIKVSDEKYSTPIQGTLYKKYSEDDNGIDIIAYEEFVKSIGNGEVIEVNKKSNGIEIKVLHGDIKAIYSKLEKVNVKKGEKIIKGHILGSMGDVSKKNKQLHFEMWKDNKSLNPLEYLESNNKTPLSYK